MNAHSRRAKKLLVADTLALLIFDMSTGLMVVAYEYFFVTFDMQHIVLVRILYMSKYIGARFCGRWTNRLRRLIINTSDSIVRKAFADALAVSSYQAPLYALSAYCAGMAKTDIVIALSIFGINALMLGWIYGPVLDYMREKFAKNTE